MSALNARLAPTQDYSDLPADVMDRYNVIEAEQAARRAIENVETAAREVVGERDDLRRRARQERLHALRASAPAACRCCHVGAGTAVAQRRQ